MVNICLFISLMYSSVTKLRNVNKQHMLYFTRENVQQLF